MKYNWNTLIVDLISGFFIFLYTQIICYVYNYCQLGEWDDQILSDP